MTLPIPEQPRPVVDAANSQNVRARWIAGIATIAGALPTFLLAFEVIAWSAEQIAAYTTFIGVVTAAVALVLGHQDVQTAEMVETQVTPVASPRDNGLVPFVPIADDFLND
jgi:hypothetical protein